MQVANTILSQLGGNRFVAMTGAKNFVGSDDALHFALPSNFARNGINRVRVTLQPSDTYTVEFFKVRGTKFSSIATRDDVYAEDLQRVFKTETGLDTHL